MLRLIFDTVEGRLLTDVASVSTLLPVDFTTFTQVQNNLAVGDWTYLELSNELYTEEVKVTGFSGNYLVVVRGTSGSTPNPFSSATTNVRRSFGPDAIKDIVAASPVTSTVTVSGAGLASVLQTGDNYEVNVDEPILEGSNGVVVTGAWPNITISMDAEVGGCCPGEGTTGGSGAGGLSSITVNNNPILGISVVGGVADMVVQPPNFTGTGITITGTWPNINFAVAEGGLGSGTVTSVTAGAGLTITGNPSVNPSISITNTGVLAGDYGGLVINAQGQILDIPAGYNPVSTVSVSNATVSRVGGTVNVALHDADVGQKGVVEIAQFSGAIDTDDESRAVTPKYLSEAMQGGVVDAQGSSTGEADSLYTNTLSTTAVTVNLAAGEKAVLIGNVVVLDGAAPATPVEYGLAIFNASGTNIVANKKCTQSSQAIVGKINGPYTGALSMVTTALPSGATVQGAILTYQKA